MLFMKKINLTDTYVGALLRLLCVLILKEIACLNCTWYAFELAAVLDLPRLQLPVLSDDLLRYWTSCALDLQRFLKRTSSYTCFVTGKRSSSKSYSFIKKQTFSKSYFFMREQNYLHNNERYFFGIFSYGSSTNEPQVYFHFS
jgi:hypothetical protein